jgi:hypothetical protein
VYEITGVEAADAGDVPTLFLAVTEKVYAVPTVKPLTVQFSGPVVQMHVFAPGLDVTVYCVVAAPEL